MDDLNATNSTQPNAYRAEAASKRAEISRLAAEANELEAQADALEKVSGDETPPAETSSADTPAEEESSNKKLFKK